MDDIEDEVNAGISDIDGQDIDELNDVRLKDLRRFRDVVLLRIIWIRKIHLLNF